MINLSKEIVRSFESEVGTRSRGPYQKMEGLYMMARGWIKRAQLSGGKTGAHSITALFGRGLSILFFEEIRVTEEDLLQRIRGASTEDEIADWLRKHADLSSVVDINERLRGRGIKMCCA